MIHVLQRLNHVLVIANIADEALHACLPHPWEQQLWFLNIDNSFLDRLDLRYSVTLPRVHFDAH